MGGLWGRKKVSAADVALGVVPAAWRRLVLPEPGEVDRRAYTLCVMEELHQAFRRRDVFCPASSRWADPRACLLDGERWAAMRPELLDGLGLDPDPTRHLEALGAKLGDAYRGVAAGLGDNALLSIDDQGRPHLSPDEALPMPASLAALKTIVASMLPRVDLPDLLIEVDGWTEFTSAFTHVSSGESRMGDLGLSVIAVLVAEACNVGLVPVLNAGVVALTRQRLSHVDQNYVRSETITAANAMLVEAQTGIELAQTWGGGQLASADGLRFVVPVRTTNAGPNPCYFGVGRGVTWLNYLSDQVAGFAAVLVPGTDRDSLFILDGLLDNETAVHPAQVTTDTASYSDQAFALGHPAGRSGRDRRPSPLLGWRGGRSRGPLLGSGPPLGWPKRRSLLTGRLSSTKTLEISKDAPSADPLTVSPLLRPTIPGRPSIPAPLGFRSWT